MVLCDERFSGDTAASADGGLSQKLSRWLRDQLTSSASPIDLATKIKGFCGRFVDTLKSSALEVPAPSAKNDSSMQPAMPKPLLMRGLYATQPNLTTATSQSQGARGGTVMKSAADIENNEDIGARKVSFNPFAANTDGEAGEEFVYIRDRSHPRGLTSC
jgi:hypothetical protein